MSWLAARYRHVEAHLGGWPDQSIKILLGVVAVLCLVLIVQPSRSVRLAGAVGIVL